MTSGDILKLNGTEVSEDVIKHLVTCHIAPLGMNGWVAYLADGQSIVVYLKDGGGLRNDKATNP